MRVIAYIIAALRWPLTRVAERCHSWASSLYAVEMRLCCGKVDEYEEYRKTKPKRQPWAGLSNLSEDAQCGDD